MKSRSCEDAHVLVTALGSILEGVDNRQERLPHRWMTTFGIIQIETPSQLADASPTRVSRLLIMSSRRPSTESRFSSQMGSRIAF